MTCSESAVKRRNVTRVISELSNNSTQIINQGSSGDETIDEAGSKEVPLTLMEEVLLLGLEDQLGYPSFWNDSLSSGLRGCILTELGLRGRVKLEKVGTSYKVLLKRKVIIADETPTGEVLLDETLKHIKEADPPETVNSWIEYLRGETWNPLKLRYQLKYVRERVAKNLVEKGVLTTDKQSFLFFDIATHPLADKITKSHLIRSIQDAVLDKWVNDPQKMDKRMLALIVLAHASDVLDNAFSTVNHEEYKLATKRVKHLLGLNFENEAQRSGTCHVMWAVFSAFKC